MFHLISDETKQFQLFMLFGELSRGGAAGCRDATAAIILLTHILQPGA